MIDCQRGAVGRSGCSESFLQLSSECLQLVVTLIVRQTDEQRLLVDGCPLTVRVRIVGHELRQLSVVELKEDTALLQDVLGKCVDVHLRIVVQQLLQLLQDIDSYDLVASEIIVVVVVGLELRSKTLFGDVLNDIVSHLHGKVTEVSVCLVTHQFVAHDSSQGFHLRSVASNLLLKGSHLLVLAHFDNRLLKV